ncbi:transmembrane protein, putative [Medicago truncatula]|nr:transmembrane protein, putative [Medicago truncatula]
MSLLFSLVCALSIYVLFFFWWQSPHHFRCGFDIVVPGDIIPEWFDHQFKGNSRLRITNFTNKNNNWLGFAFCVVFMENCGSNISYPLYLSFESEHMEETFDIPLRLDPNTVDGSNSEHLWLICISRPHCHFVTTEAHITFKAHPDVELKRWGLRMVLENDISNPFKLRTDEFCRQGYLQLDHVHVSSRSKRPEVQLRYNWHVTEEEENESREVNLKKNHLSDMGLTT